jgi:hypothetical protein
MPVKLRHPKARQHRITAGARETYRAGSWLALHQALGLKPWQPSPLDASTAEPPDWCGQRDGWPLAREVRLALEEATQAGRHGA